MNNLFNFLLTSLVNYGYPILIAGITLGYFGLPIPSESILLAAGSFSSNGSYNLYILFSVALITTLIGDSIWYFAAKKLGSQLLPRLLVRMKLSSTKYHQIQSFFSRSAFWSIFISRWLITPFGIPINIFAGLAQYPYIKFILIAIFGESLWVGIYLGLGYIFGENWQSLLTYIQNTPIILGLIVFGLMCLIIATKYLSRFTPKHQPPIKYPYQNH